MKEKSMRANVAVLLVGYSKLTTTFQIKTTTKIQEL